MDIFNQHIYILTFTTFNIYRKDIFTETCTPNSSLSLYLDNPAVYKFMIYKIQRETIARFSLKQERSDSKRKYNFCS